MSKFSGMLKMMLLLKIRGKMKADELAEKLEVSTRMVRKYRDDLDLAGIIINSTSGVNGGYSLDSNIDYLLDLSMGEEEFVAIQFANEQLKGNNFIYSRELDELVNKISVSRKIKYIKTNLVEYISKTPKANDFEDERKKCLDIHAAIIGRYKIELKYFSLNTGESERVVHPYATITYEGALYFIAYCEKKEEIIQFKLSRIKDYKITDQKFERNKNFVLRDYLKGSFGMYRGQSIKIKLKIQKPMSYIVSEKIWGDDQKVEWIENESIIFEAEFQGVTEIKSWILSMGSLAEVLEPDSLKEEIQNELIKSMNLYKK